MKASIVYYENGKEIFRHDEDSGNNIFNIEMFFLNALKRFSIKSLNLNKLSKYLRAYCGISTFDLIEILKNDKEWTVIYRDLIHKLEKNT